MINKNENNNIFAHSVTDIIEEYTKLEFTSYKLL